MLLRLLFILLPAVGIKPPPLGESFHWPKKNGSRQSLAGIKRTLSGRDSFHNPSPGCDGNDCDVFKATPEEGSRCRCQCRPQTPIFLQHRRLCADGTGECDSTVEFGQNSIAPSVFLPMRNGIIEPSARLNWQGELVAERAKSQWPSMPQRV